MSYKYDFHLHSNYSDGSNSIMEMIEGSLQKGIKYIAITDHLDSFGFFVNNYSSDADSKKILKYLEEINHLRKRYKRIIEVFPGAEISTDFLPRSNTNSRTEDVLTENLQYFSIFLLDGWWIKDPLNSSLNFKQYLKDLGFPNIPVIIAHPYFTSFKQEEFQKLIDTGVGFELNAAKFAFQEEEAFIKLIKNLGETSIKNLKLTIGSDAHLSRGAGMTFEMQDFALTYNLGDNLIKPINPPEFNKLN